MGIKAALHEPSRHLDSHVAVQCDLMLAADPVGRQPLGMRHFQNDSGGCIRCRPIIAQPQPDDLRHDRRTDTIDVDAQLARAAGNACAMEGGTQRSVAPRLGLRETSVDN